MQFDAAGFDDLRAYIRDNWQFIAVVDDGGTELIRIDVPNDSRATVLNDATDNPYTVELTLTGQDFLDAGNTLPVTAVQTEVFRTGSGTTRMGYDPVPSATLEADYDEIIITHEYRIPP